jgi:Domain of unknown function (DUF1707)
MGDLAGLRVSDEERERAASELREHFAQGRLDSDELGERLDRAYAARTSSELQTLRADLPALPPSARSSRAELAARRSELGRQLLQQTGAAFVPFLVCTLVWLFSGAQSDFWPAWVAIVGVMPLVRNGWRVYGPAPELDSVAQDLAKRGRQPPNRRR